MNDATSVRSRSELAAFVATLHANLVSDPGRWENTTLPEFLNALACYLDDLPGYCHNNAPGVDPEAATWSLLAVALAGASVYE